MRSFSAGILCLLFQIQMTQAQNADDCWDARFDELGLNGIVHTIAVNGNDVYVGGEFTLAGSLTVNHIAKWDGNNWSALGSGTDLVVQGIAVNANDVYVFGQFSIAGAVIAKNIAKWDGTTWSSVGGGIDSGEVRAMATYMGDIYVAGSISSVGGVHVSGMAKWDGTQWSRLPGDFSQGPNALSVMGNDLYVGGRFSISNLPVPFESTGDYMMAKWSIDTWTEVWPASFDYNGIKSLGNDGRNLYVIGDEGFGNISGLGEPRLSVALWGGAGYGYSIAADQSDKVIGGSFGDVHDYPYGPAICTVNSIARWNGGVWTPMGSGIKKTIDQGQIIVRALAMDQNKIYVGGDFDQAGGKPSKNFAIYHLDPVRPYRTQSIPDTSLAVNFGKSFIADLTKVFTDSNDAELNYRAWFGKFSDLGTAEISNDSLYLISNGAGGTDWVIVTAGDKSENSATDTIMVEVGAVPANPKNLSVTEDNEQVTLRWDKNSDSIIRYRIYAGILPNPTLQIDSSESQADTSQTISGLTNGLTYYFRVAAVDSDHDLSDYSNEVSACILHAQGFIDKYPLEPPTDAPYLWGAGYESSGVWMDYDGDGDLDMISTGKQISSSDPDISIYRNDNGNFDRLSSNILAVIRGSLAWGDYDNDGDLDLLISGFSNSGSIAKIYRNDHGTFTNISAGLIGLEQSSVDWGDYDNDGDLDILVTGWDGFQAVSLVYKNDGGLFEDISANLVSVYYGSATWGDYDNDGDLDILINGFTDQDVSISKIYRNDGGTFIDLNAGLIGTLQGNSAWGDFDSDGDLDLVISGVDQQSGDVLKVYKNNNGVFTDINAGLIGFVSASVAWGDYDNDGDLDILISGFSEGIATTNIYRNDAGFFTRDTQHLKRLWGGSVSWGDYDQDGKLDILLTGADSLPYYSPIAYGFTKIYQNNHEASNSVPTYPPYQSSNVVGNSVHFNWSRSDDNQTNSKGLSYNLRIGTTYSGCEIKSPMANLSSGFRSLPHMGNVNLDTTWMIKNLPDGKYYWSVQAIDNSFAGSNFSPTDSFVVDQVNDPPHLISALRDTTFNENFGKQFVFKVSNFFADVDNATLNYSVSNLNGGLSASISNDSLYLISELHFFGEADVQITGDDGSLSISDTFKVTVQRTDFPPVPPQGLTAEALAGQVRITWNRNHESDFCRYFIYGGISPNPTSLLDSCVDVDDTSKTIVGLTNDTTYYFRITATDLSNYESSYSDEISVTPAVLSNVNTQPVDTSTGSTPVVLTFSQVTQSGNVQLIISSTGPAIHEGMIFGNQVKYFDISTSNIFSGTITVSVNYSGIHFKDETAIRLFHYETDHWVDATASVDTISNIIYGAVSSLSPFALLQPANVSPQVSNSIPDTTVSEDFGKVFIRDLTGVFSDPDTPVLTFDDSSFSGGLSTVISGDSLYLLSHTNFYDSVNVMITASDSEFTIADTFLVTIAPVNDPPIANNPIADMQLNKNFGTIFVSVISNNFTDVDDFFLTYGAANLSSGVVPSISQDSLYLTLQQDFTGEVLIRLTAFDGDVTVADTFQVSVLETAPSVIQAIRDTSFSEDAGTKIIADLSLIFQDIDSPSLTYSTTSTGNALSSEIVNDRVQIVTVPDSFGVSTVIVTAEDELLQSTSDTFTVTITPLNDAPRILVSLPDGAINEDEGKKFIAKMSGTFSDPDGDMLIFSSSVSDTTKVTTIISNDSLYVLTIKDSNGAVNVHVSATDPLLTSANDTFLLTINPFNDPPFITQLLRDTTLQQDFGRIFVAKLSGYFSDIDGDELFYNVANLSAGMSAETSNDSLYLISQTYFFGEVGILVEANDGDASIIDTFVVTVSNINDAPMSLNWFNDLTINEDTSAFFAGGANFNFIDVDNDILVYDTQSSDTTKIKVRISNDSLYVYPAKDSSGMVEIYLTATDPFLEFVRDTFLITIVGVNDAPFRISSIRDTTQQQNFGKVFISRLNTIFDDIDGPGLSYTATVSPTGLSTQVSGDSLYLNSILDYFGAVNVRVIASDGSLSASDTFRVTVADNNGPSAFVNALASPVLNIVRFVAGADENLSALTLSANGQPVVMTKQGNVYFGDYTLSSTGSLPVSVTATDLSGNQDTVNRLYQVSLLNKTTVFGKYQFSSSSEGYMLLRISEDVTVPLNWKRYAENIDVVMTNVTAEIKIESTTGRLVSADEDAKLGLYEWTNGQWIYVGGEGSGGKVKAVVNKGGTYAVLYNPDHISVPKEFVLNQNFPNPFNPSTTIRYEVPDETRVTLKVYNLLGQEVRTLVDAVKGSGRYEIRWDGKNASGKEVASGVYLYRLQADKFVQTKKMLFIK